MEEHAQEGALAAVEQRLNSLRPEYVAADVGCRGEAGSLKPLSLLDVLLILV